VTIILLVLLLLLASAIFNSIIDHLSSRSRVSGSSRLLSNDESPLRHDSHDTSSDNASQPYPYEGLSRNDLLDHSSPDFFSNNDFTDRY
jgi:hypothetical protein